MFKQLGGKNINLVLKVRTNVDIWKIHSAMLLLLGKGFSWKMRSKEFRHMSKVVYSNSLFAYLQKARRTDICYQ